MPSKTRPIEEVLAELDALQLRDPQVHGKRLFGLVYPAGREDIEALVHGVYDRFPFGNALNPLKSAALAQVEKERVAMSGDHAHRTATNIHGGSMTSGERSRS